MERKLIIIRGNSGSGKTTAAIGLQKAFGANTMRISLDMIRREILMVRDGRNSKTIPLMREMLFYGAEHSPVVVLEGILPAGYYAPIFQTAIERYGEQIYAYYYDLPFEETLKRHVTKPNAMEFGETEMRAWWLEKDYLSLIEEKKIPKEQSLKETIEMIYQDVLQGKTSPVHSVTEERSLQPPHPSSGNGKTIHFYVCPICGNRLTAAEPGVFSCCGMTLVEQEAKPGEADHTLKVETGEEEYRVTMEHEMTEEHRISFITYVTSDSVETIKLYPEQPALACFRKKGSGIFYGYCTRHGLYRMTI